MFLSDYKPTIGHNFAENTYTSGVIINNDIHTESNTDSFANFDEEV